MNASRDKNEGTYLSGDMGEPYHVTTDMTYEDNKWDGEKNINSSCSLLSVCWHKKNYRLFYVWPLSAAIVETKQ